MVWTQVCRGSFLTSHQKTLDAVSIGNMLWKANAPPSKQHTVRKTPSYIPALHEMVVRGVIHSLEGRASG